MSCSLAKIFWNFKNMCSKIRLKNFQTIGLMIEIFHNFFLTMKLTCYDWHITKIKLLINSYESV